MFTLTALPAFKDNYIWVLHNAANLAVVIDPGQAEPVFAFAEAGIKPCAILLTHHHPDHIDGAAQLREAFNMPIYAPLDKRIAAASQRVCDGEEFVIPEINLRVETMAVPGHTLSHVAFRITDHLFCGDTLFSLGCGRLFEGSPEQMLSSLDRLAALPGHLKVCCGHEYTQANAAFARRVEAHNPEREHWMVYVQARRAAGKPSLPSTIATERAANPFLRTDQPALVAAVAERIGHMPDNRIHTFAALRQWKDVFSV